MSNDRISFIDIPPSEASSTRKKPKSKSKNPNEKHQPPPSSSHGSFKKKNILDGNNEAKVRKNVVKPSSSASRRHSISSANSLSKGFNNAGKLSKSSKSKSKALTTTNVTQKESKPSKKEPSKAEINQPQPTQLQPPLAQHVSATPPQPPMAVASKSKPKISGSPPQPLSATTNSKLAATASKNSSTNRERDGSVKIDMEKNNNGSKTLSYRRPDSRRTMNNAQNYSYRNNNKEYDDLNTAISNKVSYKQQQPSRNAKACIELDETKIVTKVNLSSKKSPQCCCFQIRWVLLLWSLILCSYDSTMILTTFFTKDTFLKFTYHYVFILAFPSGPSLLYLMISEKVSIFWWKTHISCQIFRVLMNIYLFIDYYCARQDEFDIIEGYQFSNGTWHGGTKENQMELHRIVDKYFAIFSAILCLATVLTVIMFGFAVNLYFYEKDALKRKQEKWRRRVNEIFESQSQHQQQPIILPETDELSSDYTDVVTFKRPRF